MHKRKCTVGSSLMEYALPMVIMLLAAGLLWTILDVNKIIAKYYMAASGQQNLVGKTFKVDKLGDTKGRVRIGSEGFRDYGEVYNGNRETIKITTTGEGLYPNAPQARSGKRPQTGGSNGEILYAMTGKPEMREFLLRANEENSYSEYVARVMNGANTTGYLGLIKDGLAEGDSKKLGYLQAYTKALISQKYANSTYAVTHPSEVAYFGGMDGVIKWQDFMIKSIKGGKEVEALAEDVGVKDRRFKDIAKKEADYDGGKSRPGQIAAINNGYTRLQNRTSTFNQYDRTSEDNLSSITANWNAQPPPPP